MTAGIAVTALVVPKNLGYAGIAGVPLQNGLYAAAAGAIIYALFCTSRQISTGPSSSLAAVAGSAVIVTGLGGKEAAQLVAAITLATGLLRFAAPAIPGALVLVAGGLIASAVFDLGAHGVALVGHVPRGLPAAQLPDFALFEHHYATVGIAAVALLLIGFSQTAGDARASSTQWCSE